MIIYLLLFYKALFFFPPPIRRNFLWLFLLFSLSLISLTLFFPADQAESSFSFSSYVLFLISLCYIPLLYSPLQAFYLWPHFLSSPPIRRIFPFFLYDSPPFKAVLFILFLILPFTQYDVKKITSPYKPYSPGSNPPIRRSFFRPEGVL